MDQGCGSSGRAPAEQMWVLSLNSGTTPLPKKNPLAGAGGKNIRMQTFNFSYMYKIWIRSVFLNWKTQVVEYLPSNETVSSNLSTTKKKKNSYVYKWVLLSHAIKQIIPSLVETTSERLFTCLWFCRSNKHCFVHLTLAPTAPQSRRSKPYTPKHV
jgi:hypothetical protein